jgi:hypothetical protein
LLTGGHYSQVVVKSGLTVIKFPQKAIVREDRRSFDQNSLDQNCVFSVDRKFHNQLIKFFETFQFEKFDQVPKSVGSFLAVD